jgi:hypothetical protein
MLSDVIQDLLSEAGARVVGELQDSPGLMLAAAAIGADVVVVGTSGNELPPSCDQALADCSRFKLLAVAGEGRHGVLYKLEPRSELLSVITGDVLREKLETSGAKVP